MTIEPTVVVYVGYPIVFGDDVQATIDCSPLIDTAINNGTSNPIVTWYKNGVEVLNRSTPNVEISADRRLLKITESFPTGGQIGSDSIYTCEVCEDPTDRKCRIPTDQYYRGSIRICGN